MIQSRILFNESGSKVDGIVTNDGVRNEAVLYSSFFEVGDVSSSGDIDLYDGEESSLAQHESIKLVRKSKNKGKSGIFVDEQYVNEHPSGCAGVALKENELW